MISDGLVFWAVSYGSNEVMVFSLKLLNWMCQHAESVSIFLISVFHKISISHLSLVQQFIQWDQEMGMLHELCHEDKDVKIHCVISAVS